MDPCFSLIILIRNVRWMSFFGTTLLTPLPNLWPTQHIYLCINNGVYACKISAIWRWSHVLVTAISDDANQNVLFHWTSLPPLHLTPKIYDVYILLSSPDITSQSLLFDTLWTITEAINMFKNCILGLWLNLLLQLHLLLPWDNWIHLRHSLFKELFLIWTIKKLDVDPQRDDDASPMSTYRCMLRPSWMISALQHKSKYKSNSISNFFEKKKSNFLVPML